MCWAFRDALLHSTHVNSHYSSICDLPFNLNASVESLLTSVINKAFWLTELLSLDVCVYRTILCKL
uniref:Uncharacterized protein n=1 Tax=Anguilla anguilla TaxID=7936 RepID=A0A0E9XQJ3_ANGAN